MRSRDPGTEARDGGARAWLVPALLAGLLALLIVSQGRAPGFERAHHGWVSAHVLAIVGHASPRTGFVGYAVQTREPDGSSEYHYFQRSPVPFSVVLKGVLEGAGERAGDRIYLARQAMNGVFVATMGLAFLVLRRLGYDRVRAATAVLLAFAGYYVTFYRDLVSGDLPAVLGMLLIVYGAARYRQEGRVWALYAGAVAGVSLGFGYASLAALGLWAALEGWERLRASHGSWTPRALGRAASGPAARALLLGVAFAAGYVGYNAAMEARVREVGIGETSLVNGAVRRLGLDPSFATEGRERPLSWARHAATLGERITAGLAPYPFGVGEPVKQAVEYYVQRAGLPGTLLAVAGVAVLLVVQTRRHGPRERPLFLLLALSGLAWLGPMKNLSLPHNYTAIYLLGLSLAVYAALANRLPRPARGPALALALAVFVGASLSAQETHRLRAAEASHYTADLERIAELLPAGASVHVAGEYAIRVDQSPDLVPGAPYAVGFFLPEAYLSPLAGAQYVLARDRDLALGGRAAQLMTPENERVFLFSLAPPGASSRAGGEGGLAMRGEGG